MDKLLRIEDVEALTGIPVGTLRHWRAIGQGPKSAKFGKRIVYREGDVTAWVNAQFESAGS